MFPLSRKGTLAYSMGLLAAGIFYSFNNFTLPLYLSIYTSNAILIGWLSSTRSFEQAIVQPFVGAWSDRTRTRFGRRAPFFLTAMPAAAVLLMINGLLPHDPAFLWIVVAVAFAFSFLFNIGIDPYFALLADATTPEQRGTVNGIAQVFGFVGQVVLLVAAAFLWTIHPAWVFSLVAVCLVAGFGVVALGVREPKHLAGEEHTGAERQGGVALPALIAEMRSRLVAKPRVAIIGMGTGLAVFTAAQIIIADVVIAAAVGAALGILIGLLMSLDLWPLLIEHMTVPRLLRLALLVLAAWVIGVIVGGLAGAVVALVPTLLAFALAGQGPAFLLAALILILVGAPAGALAGWKAGVYILSLYSEQAQPVKMLAVKFLYQLGINAAAPFITLFVVSEIGVNGWSDLVSVIPFGSALGLNRMDAQAISQLVPALMLITMGITAVPIGTLGDRFGKRKIFGIGLLVMGLAGLLAATAVSLPQLMVFVFFIGLGNAAQTVLFFPYLTELVPASRVGEFTGLAAFAETGGVALSVLLAGALINWNPYGLHYRLVFIVTGLFILLAFAALLLVRREHPYIKPVITPVPGS